MSDYLFLQGVNWGMFGAFKCGETPLPGKPLDNDFIIASAEFNFAKKVNTKVSIKS